MFDGTSPEVIQVGVLYLRLCCGVNSLIYAAMYTLDSFAIGVGAAHVAMANALLDAVVVRLPVAWLLAFSFSIGFSGIYLGQALSPILPALVGFTYFKSRGWERKTLVRDAFERGQRKQIRGGKEYESIQHLSPNRRYSDRLSQPSRDRLQHTCGELHHV